MKYSKAEDITKVAITAPKMKVNFSPAESFVTVNAPKVKRNNPSV